MAQRKAARTQEIKEKGRPVSKPTAIRPATYV